MAQLTNTGAIQRYMSSVGTSGNSEDYKKVTLAEFNACTAEERAEMGALAAVELGMTIGQPIPENV